MKKLLALLLALAMVFALAACGSGETVDTAPSETQPAETEPTETEPVVEYEFAQYTYVEDRGDFEVTWIFTVMGEVYSLEEINGMSGGDDIHGVTTYTDNGDGTITTGPWTDADSNKSDFFEPDGTCTWILGEDGKSFEPVNAGESSGSEGSVNPGQYTYVDGDTTWVIKIMGNGSCVIDETDTASGEVIKEHTTRESDQGNGWTDNGNGTFETNEWEPEEREDNKVALASPNGVTNWKVVDAENGLVEPTEKVEENTIAYGAYHYTDAEGNLYSVMIMGNGDCTIQPNDADGNIMMREEGGPVEYKAEGFEVNADGTFTTLAMVDQSDIPAFLEGDGTATWRITDAENMTVELVTE